MNTYERGMRNDLLVMAERAAKHLVNFYTLRRTNRDYEDELYHLFSDCQIFAAELEARTDAKEQS